ncbi:flagella synthesis protein FlgN [Halomonas sp. WWR20]
MNYRECLRRQKAALESFVALLDEEHLQLAQGQIDGEALSRLAADKQRIAAEMEEYEQARLAAQRASGHGEGLRGAERAAQESQCLDDWGDMRTLAEQARQKNRMNGLMINMRLEHNQKAINFLSEAAGSTLYGPTGQSRRKGFGGISSRA